MFVTEVYQLVGFLLGTGRDLLFCWGTPNNRFFMYLSLSLYVVCVSGKNQTTSCLCLQLDSSG